VSEINVINNNYSNCNNNNNNNNTSNIFSLPVQWPRCLRRRSTTARPLRFWVRIPPEAWMFVCCEGCLSSGRILCGGFITRPEGSYRLWLVVVCDLETSKMRRLKPAAGLWKIQPKDYNAKKTKNIFSQVANGCRLIKYHRCFHQTTQHQD